MRKALAVTACILALTGCEQVEDHDHPRLKTGEQMYNHYCASCHQRSGDGAFFDGIPAVKYTPMKIHEIVDHIRGHGRADDSRMPRFSGLSRYEAERIAVYIRLELRAR